MTNQEDQAPSPKRKTAVSPRAWTTRRVLRILLVPMLCFIAVISGLMVGYVVIGEQDMGDVWKISTWKHVFDLMFASR